MPSLTLPKAPLTQLRGKPVAGTWRLFRFGGSWSPVSPKVKLHQGEGQTLLLDGGEVFVRDSR
jgi:hypothetical protein